MKSNRLSAVLAVVLLTIIIAGQYFFRQSSPENKSVLYSACRLTTEDCPLQYDTAAYTVSISDDVKALRPFFISITDPAQKITKAVLNLKMREMDMGQNRYTFSRVSADSWRAKVIIPVCTSGKRNWLIELSVDDQTSSRITVFEINI
ncbi:MAG: hypothetical protein OEY36_02625 [Gammaproteobacteria bacterium]|nr:hypothetical protein [Gammaproteobacteria bacterium]